MRYLATIAVLLLGLLLSGCQPDAGTVSVADPSGTYVLEKVNGHTLPYTPPHEGGAPEVQSGSITLVADGTFTSKMSYKAGGKTGSRDFSGTYTREGSNFKLQWKGAGTTTATLEGDTFIMMNEGLALVYKK